MDETREEGAGREHDRSGMQFGPRPRSDTEHPPFRQDQVLGPLLQHGQILFCADRVLHRALVELTISLGTRPTNSRTLSPVQQPELDSRLVGDPPHQSVERVDLPDQMPLAQPADRWIAGHFADRVAAMRQQERPCAGTSRR